MVPIEETSHLLITMLRALGDEYGPLGVALAAAQLSDPDAVVQHLQTWKQMRAQFDGGGA